MVDWLIYLSVYTSMPLFFFWFHVFIRCKLWFYLKLHIINNGCRMLVRIEQFTTGKSFIRKTALSKFIQGSMEFIFGRFYCEKAAKKDKCLFSFLNRSLLGIGKTYNRISWENYSNKKSIFYLHTYKTLKTNFVVINTNI